MGCAKSPYAEWDTPVEIEVEGGLSHRYPSPDSLPTFELSGEAFSPFGIYEMSYRLDGRFPEKLPVRRDTTQAEVPVSFSISLKTKLLEAEKHELHISGLDSSGNVQTLTVQLNPYR